MSSKNVYVISTLEDTKENIYKIGVHTGSQKLLLSRYRTYLINPEIYYYRLTTNSEKIDSKIKKELKEYRLKDEDGRYTEWFQLQLNKIRKCIDGIIEENDNKYETKIDAYAAAGSERRL